MYSISRDIATAEDAIKRGLELESGRTDILQEQEVWSLPITDAMRTKAQTEGFPLFANPPTAALPAMVAPRQESKQEPPSVRGFLDEAFSGFTVQ